jgi:hypothetical protein
MKAERMQEIHQMLESYQQTDNGDLDSEKTAVIEELLMEVERLDKARWTSEREDLNATSD